MNEYVVTINESKENIQLINNHLLIVEDEQLNVELLEINKNSYLLHIENKSYEIAVEKINNETYSFLLDGYYFKSVVRTRLQEKAKRLLNNKEYDTHHDIIKAPMPGLVLKIKKKEGEKIEIGEAVVILEAMKMENEIRSPASGIVKEILVNEGSSVEKDDVIIKIE